MVATYISGEQNSVADEISRMHIGDAWQLNMEIFE
jgi:hypothetical protein